MDDLNELDALHRAAIQLQVLQGDALLWQLGDYLVDNTDGSEAAIEQATVALVALGYEPQTLNFMTKLYRLAVKRRTPNEAAG